MSVTGRAAAALVVCAVLAAAGGPWIGAFASLAVAVAVCVDANFARRPIAAARTMASRLARGVGTEMVVTVTGAAGRVGLRQPLPPDMAASISSVDGVELRSIVTPLRRGRHLMGRAAVAVDGPLGLGRWMHHACAEQVVTVYPDLPAAWRLVQSMRRGGFSDAGRLIRGPLGLGTEFEAVRDYSTDDDFRQINWSATARVGRPMSNSYRVEQDRDVICCVDTGRLMAAPIGTATRLDLVLDAVVAVALVADEMGDRCGLVAFADRVLRVADPKRLGSRTVIDGCIDLEPVLVDSDYEAAFQRVGGAKRSLVLVFTDLVEPGAARPLLEAVSVLARHHFLVVVGVDDPDLLSLAAQDCAPLGTLSAARATVAHDILADRDAVVARLRGAGATVVSALPGELAASCVRTYLRAKNSARL